MANLVVKIEKSGNRYNAWDADGIKYTSEISISARKRAHSKGMALEQRVNKSGKNYWWVVPMSEFEAIQLLLLICLQLRFQVTTLRF